MDLYFITIVCRLSVKTILFYHLAQVIVRHALNFPNASEALRYKNFEKYFSANIVAYL